MKELKHASEYIKAYEPSEIEISEFQAIIGYIEDKYQKGLRLLDVVIKRKAHDYILKNLTEKGFKVQEIKEGYYDKWEGKLIIRVEW